MPLSLSILPCRAPIMGEDVYYFYGFLPNPVERFLCYYDFIDFLE